MGKSIERLEGAQTEATHTHTCASARLPVLDKNEPELQSTQRRCLCCLGGLFAAVALSLCLGIGLEPDGGGGGGPLRLPADHCQRELIFVEQRGSHRLFCLLRRVLQPVLFVRHGGAGERRGREGGGESGRKKKGERGRKAAEREEKEESRSERKMRGSGERRSEERVEQEGKER